VFLLAMIAEPLAVIGGHGQDRSIKSARLAKARDQAPYQFVRIGHRAVVGIAQALVRTGGGRYGACGS